MNQHTDLSDCWRAELDRQLEEAMRDAPRAWYYADAIQPTPDAVAEQERLRAMDPPF